MTTTAKTKPAKKTARDEPPLVGAVEFLAVQVKEGSERIADALHDIATAISNHKEDRR